MISMHLFIDEKFHDLYIPSNTPLVTTSGRLLVESAWTYGSEWKVKIGWCPKIFGWSCIEPFATFSILKIKNNRINGRKLSLDKYTISYIFKYLFKILKLRFTSCEIHFLCPKNWELAVLLPINATFSVCIILTRLVVVLKLLVVSFLLFSVEMVQYLNYLSSTEN